MSFASQMGRPIREGLEEGIFDLQGLFSAMGGARRARRMAVRQVLRRAQPLLLLAVVALVLARAAGGEQPQSAVLRGVVRDAAGRAVADAQVVLQGKSLEVSRAVSTDTAGRFAFPGVARGAFTLTASRGRLRSAPVAVTVTGSGEQPPVGLVLGDAGAQPKGAAAGDASQAMQFADKPDFAIAAVTDWTAAGGHGSDSMLRTSEALTRQAVDLKAGSAEAAAAGAAGGAGRGEESETALRDAAAKDPEGFAANYRLGAFYIQAGRYKEALLPLQRAYEADPASYDDEYDLAQALRMAGDDAQAREHVRRMLTRRPSAELRRMEGELDEKLGDPLSAVREFQEAASEDPSEDNYFAWGSELLIHRAIWQANEVFDEGVRLYPDSARMLTARGAALFAGAEYDRAALDLCRASDLSPENPEPYLFMGKIEVAAPDPLPCVVAKLQRFEKLRPADSLANYYYGMALWKQQGQEADPRIMESVKALLTRAVTLDPECADGYFELGNLSAGQKQWEQAIGLYLQAIEANPELSEAHYRLGVAYERAGEKTKAREQFQLHDAIARKQAAEIQRQRLAVKQFVVVLPGRADKQQPAQ